MIARFTETPCFFPCNGASLLGVIAAPHEPPHVGVVIVVGGPQYRAGSHRQFVTLARALAAEGFGCLRFDYRGIGDSDGTRRTFTDIGDDVRAAVDEMCHRLPSVRRIVLWGLCDGASAAAFYAPTDSRIYGVALFNPWVRTVGGAAETAVRHYYGRRVLAPAFWRKLATGRVDPRRSLREFVRAVSVAVSSREAGDSRCGTSLPDRLAAGIARFAGDVLVCLSDNDHVAAEFRTAATRPGALSAALRRARVREVQIAGADHTFSTSEWQAHATAATLAWLREAVASGAAHGTQQMEQLA